MLMFVGFHVGPNANSNATAAMGKVSNAMVVFDFNDVRVDDKYHKGYSTSGFLYYNTKHLKFISFKRRF